MTDVKTKNDDRTLPEETAKNSSGEAGLSIECQEVALKNEWLNYELIDKALANTNSKVDAVSCLKFICSKCSASIDIKNLRGKLETFGPENPIL
ncbi:MAG: hypothetical protein V3T17_13240 [Pseudomonadales bacterium]